MTRTSRGTLSALALLLGLVGAALLWQGCPARESPRVVGGAPVIEPRPAADAGSGAGARRQVAAPEAVPDGSAVCLIGRVETADGAAVAGVSIALEHAAVPGALTVLDTAVSERGGRIRFTLAPSWARAERLSLYARDRSYRSVKRRSVALPAAIAAEPIDCGVLVVRPVSMWTEVTVVDPTGRGLAAQVFVQASQGGLYLATDEAGRAWAPLLEGESIEHARVAAAGYGVAFVPGPPQPNPAVLRCVCGQRGRDAVLRLATRDGPLRDASLVLRGIYGVRDDYLEPRRTNADGTCALANVPVGRSEYALTVATRDDSWAARNEFWRTVDAGEALVFDLHGKRGVRVRTREGAGRPLPGCWVWIVEANGTYLRRETDELGEVAFEDLTVPAAVTVQAAGFAESTYALAPDAADVLEVVLAPAKPFAGTVTSRGAPLADVAVWFAAEATDGVAATHRFPRERVSTGGDGRFSLRHAPASRGFLVFEKPGFLDRRLEVGSWTGSAELSSSAWVGVDLRGVAVNATSGETIGRFRCLASRALEPRDPAEFRRGVERAGRVTCREAGGARWAILEGVQARPGDSIRARVEIAGVGERELTLTAREQVEELDVAWR